MGLLTDIFGYGDIKGKETKTATTAWADYIRGLDEDTLNKAMSVSLGGGEQMPFITGSQRYAQDMLRDISPKTLTDELELNSPSLLQSISGGLTDLTKIGTGVGDLYKIVTGKEAPGLLSLLGLGSGASDSSGGGMSLLPGAGGASSAASGGSTLASLLGGGAVAEAGGLPLLGSLTGGAGATGLPLLGSLTGAEEGVGGLNLLGSLTGGGETAAAGTAGEGGLMSSIGSMPLAIPAALAAAPLLGPMITDLVRKADPFGHDKPTAPNARDYLKAYVSGTGIPEWGLSAEEVQKADPQALAQQIAYQGQNSSAMGSDVGPSASGDYTYPGMTLDLGDGHSYTVPGAQNITNPEQLMDSAATHGTAPSNVNIEVWNQAVESEHAVKVRHEFIKRSYAK